MVSPIKSRPFYIFLLTAWMVLTVSQAFAGEPLPPPSQDMPLGERLVYKITWLGIPVGSGEVWVKEKIILRGRGVFHVVGTVVTNKVLRTIFPMHDEAHSWIDAETFESVQFEKNIDELFLDSHERLTFDREKSQGYFESFKTGKKSEFKVTVPVHDVLSAFFWIRRNLSEPDKTLQITATADQMDWNVTVPGFQRQIVEIGDRKTDALRVNPVTRVNGKETRGKAWFNLSADTFRKPLRIVYKAPFGHVVGTLQEEIVSAEKGSLSHGLNKE